jgi:hypothetical protein
MNALHHANAKKTRKKKRAADEWRILDFGLWIADCGLRKHRTNTDNERRPSYKNVVGPAEKRAVVTVSQIETTNLRGNS